MNNQEYDLLERAFKSEERDNRLDGVSVKRGESELTFISSNSNSYMYNGELPEGMLESGRTEPWDFGPGEPYFVFDKPIDLNSMRRAITETFGSSILIKRREGDGLCVELDDSRNLNIFSCWDLNGRGRLNYYIGSNEDIAPKFIQTVLRYLELTKEIL